MKNFVEDSKYIYYLDGSIFSKHYKRFIKPQKHKDGYLQFGDNNYKPTKSKLVHRAIYEKFYGLNLEGLFIDHINNIRDDNRLCNLQILTNQQNSQKCLIYKTNKSGYKGVYYHKRDYKWNSKIRYNGKNIHLGYFDDINEAKIAYNNKAKYLNDNHDCCYTLNTDT